ncbi:MAG: cytochrome-c oxidase, cbb3-type subunit III [Rhodobacteraceae bacterium]|nr:cytochrome-c oxidase, cbb3-type subunit III [Paracoccaceae bacterium]
MSQNSTSIDPATGAEIRSHEWDGIRELDNPLPRWWFWIFLICVVWSIGYWIAMPSWPLATTYLKGTLGWSQRANVAADIAALQESRRPIEQELMAANLDDIENDPDLFSFALASGRSAFKDNCAPCHGAGAQGAIGYPNLNDDDWLWGGTLADIEQTIQHGIRNASMDSRFSEMPAYLTLGTLDRAQVSDVTEYVLSLSGRAEDAQAAERGSSTFAEQCVTCHGEDGKGMRDQGAPNLTDSIWLYGGDRDSIFETIAKARNSSMPIWGERLPAPTVRALAVYVHSLGGGEKSTMNMEGAQ